MYKKIIYKKVTLGNDPFSVSFIERVKQTPHYQTLILLKKNPNIPLKDTPYYDFLKEKSKEWITFNKDKPILKTEEDYQNQFNRFKTLFQNSNNWINKEKDIIATKIIGDKFYYFGNYPCYLAGDGEFYIYDGNHRVSILVFLNMPITLTICQTSPEWEIFVKEVETLYPTKFLYQQIHHPYFDDWKVSRNNEKEKILKSLIKKYNINTIVDLGSCHGHTLYELKNFLKKGYGIEYNKTRFDIMKLVFRKINMPYFNGDILEFMKIHCPNIDSILSLAVFHHFLKEHPLGDFEELLRLISRKARFLIYELPHNKEIQYKWMPSYLNIDNMITSVTNFTKVEEFNLVNTRKLIVLKK